MRDILPEEVLTRIRDRYVTGVADAEAGFNYNDADEDSLTGALGQAISTSNVIRQRVGKDRYEWKIYSRKIRGRGPRAPEKPLGADGIFQIEILDAHGHVVRRKGLPFQAKKGWSAADHRLVDQSKKLLKAAGTGIVIDLAPRGYTSCTLEDVIAANGHKREALAADTVHPLGQVLGDDFLECTIGKVGLYFDPEEERFVEQSIPMGAEALAVTTKVRRRTILRSPRGV